MTRSTARGTAAKKKFMTWFKTHGKCKTWQLRCCPLACKASVIDCNDCAGARGALTALPSGRPRWHRVNSVTPFLFKSWGSYGYVQRLWLLFRRPVFESIKTRRVNFQFLFPSTRIRSITNAFADLKPKNDKKIKNNQQSLVA